MNGAHIHLLVNHLPIVGTALAVVLLLLALLHQSERGALRAAILVLALSGVGAAAAYLSGEPAEKIVEPLAEVSKTALETHEDRAAFAAGSTIVTALLGIAVLVLVERKRIGVKTPVVVLLAATLFSTAAMGWTGAAGGEIRHSEIRSGGTSGTPLRSPDTPEGNDRRNGHDDD